MNANHPHHTHRALPPHPHTMQPTVYRPFSSHSTPASFPILAVAVVGIVATAFLLICYYIFVIKCCLNLQRFRFFSRFSGSGGRPQGDPLVVYATAPRGRGLDESVIRAIPIFRLKRAQDGQEKAVTECAVCLCEFHEDEMLRLLPNCNHAFHIDCIDTWLQCNANCPICRSSITTTTYPFDPTVGSPLHDLQYPIQSISDTGRDLVIEVADLELNRSGRSLDNSHVQASISAWQRPSPKKLEQWLQGKKQRRFDQLSSKGDECIDVRRRVDDEFQVQPIRRSFSMDSSGDRQLYLHIREVLHQNPQLVEGSSASCEGTSSSGSTSRFRRSFFSFGHGRGSRNAVLPVQDSV